MAERTKLGRDERIAQSLAWLARYEALADDWTAFRDALERAPPIDLFVLPARRGVDAVEATLTARGLRVERFTSAPHHLRVHGHEGAGTLPEVVLGFAYPQGVSSALGPQALAPQSGEVLLDMCAAPGGKTVMLDALAGSEAAILAGEPSAGRAGILVQTLGRSGALGALVVQQDGQAFPAVARIDRVLLDAPCSGEGTFRVPSPRYQPRDGNGSLQMAPLQRRLLTRALDLLAPGGRLLYSTCAYAPEENEAVLDAVLGTREDVRIEALPAGPPGLPGITEWGDQRFREDVRCARRILPHHLGSWGFFVALLSKDPDSTRVSKPRFRKPLPEGAPAPLAFDDGEGRARAVDHATTLYGIDPAVFDDLVFVSRGRDVFATTATARSIDLSRLRAVAPGLRFLRGTSSGPQLTNAALRWLGARITRHVVDVGFEQAMALLEGPQPVEGLQNAKALAVRVDGVIVSKGNASGGMLALELPAGWR